MSDNVAIMTELQEIRRSISHLDSKMSETQRDLQADINSIRAEIHTIRAEILEFQLKAQQLDDISNWTGRFREKLTISDLEKIKDEVDQLKVYKAKSTVVFAIVQFGMAAVVAYLTKG